MPTPAALGNPTRPRGNAFEEDVRFILSEVQPESYLAGVAAFPADTIVSEAVEETNGRHAFATEVDFLLHARDGQVDYLVLIECKAQRIVSSRNDAVTADDDWFVSYPSEKPGAPPTRKSVKTQLRRQADTLLLNVEPLEGRHRLHCIGVAITDQPSETTLILHDKKSHPEFFLVPVGRLADWLRKFATDFEILRVQQSAILRRLRQGQAVPELGHPELPNAVAFARRVRAFLDSELFRHFQPKQRHWAINGSAGMGKSVLLSYAVTVAATDRFIDRLRDGTTAHLQLFSDRAREIGLPPLEKRRVIVAAHSHKQRAVLVDLYRRFEQHYNEIDPYTEHRRIKPAIRTWSEVTDADLAEANVVFVDEAHDLNEAGQARLKTWFDAAPNHCLIVACDRHQKLRLLRRDARILDGFDFSRCTTRLIRNYRNPFPIHAASVALLFRWFPAAGPKVVPSKEDLEVGLGFQAEARTDKEVVLLTREDAHPANNWSHLVASFRSPHALMEQISEHPLAKEDLLWVRFAEEDPDFSYELLHRYTYHNLLSPDAAELTDKYIKGQEFPIVVVEGLPRAAAWSELEKEFPALDDEQRLQQMWNARRLIYLAASRATVFLFFIVGERDPVEFRNEIASLLDQLARPTRETRQSPSGKKWGVRFAPGQMPWDMSQYLRLFASDLTTAREQSATASAEAPTAVKPEVITPVTTPGPKVEATTEVTKPVVPPEHWPEKPPSLEDVIGLVEPSLGKLLPLQEVERFCMDRALRASGASKEAIRACRPQFVAAIGPCVPRIRTLHRLASATTRSGREAKEVLLLRRYLATPPLAEWVTVQPEQSPNSAPTEVARNIQPAASGMPAPALEEVLSAIAPAEPHVLPETPIERYYVDRILRDYVPSPKAVSRCRAEFLNALNRSGKAFRLTRQAALLPPDGDDTEATSRMRSYLSTRLVDKPESLGTQGSSGSPTTASDSASVPQSSSTPRQVVTGTTPRAVAARGRQDRRPLVLMRPCDVERPVTSYRLAEAMSVPRSQVVDAVIQAGFRSFSEHMEIPDDTAAEIARVLGRKLNIITPIAQAAAEKEARVVRIRQPIVVRNFAADLGLKPFMLVAELLNIGVFAKLDQTIDVKTAAQVALRRGVLLEIEDLETTRKT